MSKKVKIFAIVVGVIAVLIFAFSHIGGSAPVDTSLTPNAPAADGSVPVGRSATPLAKAVPGNSGAVSSAVSVSQFSTLLSSISGISLDTSIFSNPAYLALRRNPVTLGTAIIGRPNPFAPIGIDGAATFTAPVLQIETLIAGKVVGTSAELAALVTATSSAPSTVVFQYGTTSALGTASAPVVTGTNGIALFTATGLKPKTMYYAQASAVQGSSTATGNVTQFTTTAATH
jgi:hypothetical protein